MRKTLLLALTIIAAALSQSVSAQVIKGYGLTVAQGTFTPIADGSVIIAGNEGITEDDNIATWCFFNDSIAKEKGEEFEGYPIGFNFTYGNRTVTTFGVSGSGYLILRGDGKFPFDVTCRHYVFTNEEDSYNDVMGIALPMNTLGADSKISYKTEGEPGNRTLTVELANIRISTSAWRMSDTPGVGTIQYILSEADNSIKVVLNGWKFEEGDSGYNCRFALRANFKEGPAVEPDTNDGVNWALSTASIAYTTVPTIDYGDACGITDGLTFTFNYPAPAVAPTAQPTGLQLEATPFTITYGFTPAENVDTYLVYYTEGDATPGTPENGVQYSAGDKLGDATVAFFGTYPEEDYNRIIENLSQSTKYNIYVVSSNSFGSGGPLYLTTDPLTASVFTAPDAPAGVTVTANTKTSVTGTCTPNGANHEVLVIYSTTLVHHIPMGSEGDFGTPSGTYSVGDTVEEGHDGKVAYVGPAGEFTIDNLTASTPVLIAVYSRDQNGTYSASYASANASTVCEVPYEPIITRWTPYIDTPLGWDTDEFRPDWQSEYIEETGESVNYISCFKSNNIKGSTDAPATAFMRLPKIDVTKRAEFTVEWNAQISASRFAWNAYTFTNDDDFIRLEVSEDGETWTTLTQVDKNNAPVYEASDIYTPISAKLKDYVGKEVYLRVFISNTQAGFWGAAYRLKNFAVKEYEDPTIPVVTVTDVKTESAVVNWESPYEYFELECISELSRMGLTTEAKTYTLTNLSPLTTYQVRVRAILDEDNYGEWSDYVSFTTPDWPSVPAPTDLKATVTGTSVKIEWSNHEDYISYTVHLRPADVTMWEEITGITTNTYTVKDLLPNTTYLWSVKAECTHGRTTGWASQDEFTTEEPLGISDANGKLRAAYTANALTILNPGTQINSIAVFDNEGRTLCNQTINAATNVTIPMATAPNIIIVRLETASGTRTFRMIR